MAEGGAYSGDFRVGELSEENLQEQQDEVTALQAIYDDKIILLSSASLEDSESRYAFQVCIPVQLPSDEIDVEAWLPIETDMTQTEGLAAGNANGRPNLCRSNSGRRWHSTYTLSDLPPLQMSVSFPTDYPESTPPIFTLTCHWLDGGQLSALCRHLDAMWGEMQHQPIVFTWVDWLQNEIFSFLGLEKTVVLTPYIEKDVELLGPIDPRALPMNCDLQQGIMEILRHNAMFETDKFQKENHDCGVCFDNRPGKDFYRLKSCRHHFCHDCLAFYCDTHVSEGTVQLLLCPDIDCKNPLPPALVREVLNDEQFHRWETIMLQKTLDAMEDIDYCPRCNMAVIKELDSSKLAHCTTCFFSYCTDCKENWHQGTKCRTVEDKLEELEEKEANQESEDARIIAEKLKAFFREEKLSKQAIKDTTIACPGCRVRIQKSSGCNYMTCSKCRINFCWQCLALITSYGHFSDGNCQTFDIRGVVDEGYIPPRADRARPRRPLAEGAVHFRNVLSENPERQKDVGRCPMCHQRSLREDNNNHIKCWCCNTNFCFLCKQRILGKVTAHFLPPYPCRQHTD